MQSLPQELQQALTEAPKPQSETEVLQESNRKYKALTSELRVLIGDKVALQAKLDRTKSMYAAQLAEMQTLLTALTSKQNEVLTVQETLKTQLTVPAQETIPGLEAALQEAGLSASEEQINTVKARLQAGSSPPDAEMTDPTARLKAELEAARQQIQSLRAAVAQAGDGALGQPQPKKQRPNPEEVPKDGTDADTKTRSRSPKNRAGGAKASDEKADPSL